MTHSNGGNEINLDLVRDLAQVLNENGLSEIEVTAGDLRVRVARSVTVATPAALPPGVSRGGDDTAAAGNDEAARLSHPGLLTSPMVGVVYTQPEPDAPPFVRVGDTVSVGDTILLIEAMKVFNTISAHRAGRITRIFVSNGIPVEFGEPLVIIE